MSLAAWASPSACTIFCCLSWTAFSTMNWARCASCWAVITFWSQNYYSLLWRINEQLCFSALVLTAKKGIPVSCSIHCTTCKVHKWRKTVENNITEEDLSVHIVWPYSCMTTSRTTLIKYLQKFVQYVEPFTWRKWMKWYNNEKPFFFTEISRTSQVNETWDPHTQLLNCVCDCHISWVLQSQCQHVLLYTETENVESVMRTNTAKSSKQRHLNSLPRNNHAIAIIMYFWMVKKDNGANFWLQ